MSELPRKFVSQLRRFIGNRRRMRRVRVRLAFTLRPEDLHASSNGLRHLPSLPGHTLDMSTTGLALIVPAIRIGGHYLAGTERRLQLNLELPNGSVEMQLVPVRYESLPEEDEENGYLIGARIVEMRDTDRARYEQYIAELIAKQGV